MGDSFCCLHRGCGALFDPVTVAQPQRSSTPRRPVTHPQDSLSSQCHAHFVASHLQCQEKEAHRRRGTVSHLAVCPGGQEGQRHPGLDQEWCGQQEQGGDRAPVLGAGEAAPGVLCSVLGPSPQEGH